MQQPTQDSAPVTLVVLAFIAVYFIWGSTYLAIRVAIESIPPLLMLGARFGLAGLLMYGFLRLRGKAAPPAKQWGLGALVGSTMLGVGTGSVAWAEQYLSSGLAALLVTTVPIWMVVLDWVWKRATRPGLRVFLGLALGCIGILLLVDPSTALAGDTPQVGPMLLILLGAFSWSAGSIYARDADLPRDPFMSTALQMAGGGAGLVLGGLVMGEWAALDVGAITLVSFLGWAYLLLFGSFIAFSAFVWLMRNVSSAKVATYAYVNPVVAVALGWLLLDEPVSGQMLVAIVVLISAVILITLPTASARRFSPSRWLHKPPQRKPVERPKDRVHSSPAPVQQT